MADSTSAVLETATVPDRAAIERAERFTRERFVHAGESVADALAPGSARRRALDAALRELQDGREVPSTRWRRRYSLLLGLERLLSEDEPHLADDTTLNPHQVDALSGTLTALLAAEQNGAAHEHDEPAAAPVLAVDDEPEEAAGADEPDLDAELAGLDVDLEDEPDEEAPEPAAFEDFDEAPPDVDADVAEGAAEDPNAHKRFWFEHATGAGKTVAAMGFVEASRTGGILILTHRRNLVDQFLGELRTRGYAERESPPLLDGAGTEAAGAPVGPVTVETYQWFVRNAGRISDAYTIVVCDEAHTALGEKTSAAIRAWTGPIFIGMTATGALIARHVTDLFPTQTSRFDLAQAARRGVIAPLRCIRIPPGPGVRTIAKVPLRRGDVDVEFDQEMLAELLDQLPFNLAIADLYRTRFNGVPGVVYAAGVRHAYNVAEAFRQVDIRAEAVSGETPKRELAEILAHYERGDIDVLVNAQLLAEGWNSPRATICMHLAPTASKRIYQQRVGRVTRRHPGKEAGVVVDFVHPATKHDDPVVTLHSLLDRDVYRGGAIVVGPVRRGRGRRVRVERRVIPVCADEERRHEVFERELWRIAVEHLDYGEQHMWAALAGARVTASGWRRARAMLHFDRSGELKRRFLLTAVERNKVAQLRLRALQEIAASRDAEAFDLSIDVIGGWSREERREAAKVMLQALAERRIGRRDQANAWIWRLAEYTREVHEEYAVQRWPETKRLLGLLVNSSGGAHARNARRLVHASRKHDRRLSAALLAAAVAHTPEAEEVLRGARTRMARKPSALSRELLRNFPKGRRGRNRRRRRKGDAEAVAAAAPGQLLEAASTAPPGGDGAPDVEPTEHETLAAADAVAAAAAQAEATEPPAGADEVDAAADEAAEPPAGAEESEGEVAAGEAEAAAPPAGAEETAGEAEAARGEAEAAAPPVGAEDAAREGQPAAGEAEAAAPAADTERPPVQPEPPKRRRTRTRKAAASGDGAAAGASDAANEPAPKKPARARRSRAKGAEAAAAEAAAEAAQGAAAADAAPADAVPDAEPPPKRRASRRRSAAAGGPDEQGVAEALRADAGDAAGDSPLDDDGREQLEARVADALDDGSGQAAA
jgi:ribonuclease E